MSLGIHHILPKKNHTCDSLCELSSQIVLTVNFERVLLFGRHILFTCRQTRFPVLPFKSLYQSYKFHSLKMGYLVDPQGGPVECCVLLSTKHTSWEMAHLTSAFLPKKGGDIFFHLPGSQQQPFKARLGKERPPSPRFGAEGVCSNMSTDAVMILCSPFPYLYARKYTQKILEIMTLTNFRIRRVGVCDCQILMTKPKIFLKNTL